MIDLALDIEGPAALDIEGPAAPPRANGELVFEAPWESRVFGLTLALHERGRFVWDDFRALLIEEIARWEASVEHDSEPPAYSYYERWLAALERLVADRALCDPTALEALVREYAARPDGHDHDHGHDHT